MLSNAGTTSAYAENTLMCAAGMLAAWNYLRVRGEYFPVAQHRHQVSELPPRTRRILFRGDLSLNHRGTTSAYAENTFVNSTVVAENRNYLRVRGEYF